MDLAAAELWMREALLEARIAESEGEVPIGAVLLMNDKIVGRGRNRSIGSHDPTAHAEVIALRSAAVALRNYRLPGATLVVTVEPCIMCTGALIHARIDLLIYGTTDPKAGAVDSHFQLAHATPLNHRIEVVSGVLEAECRSVLKKFFEERR